MRCLVTGGAGFIGSHLVEALLRSGHEVRVLDNLASGTLDNLPRHRFMEFQRGDLRDLDAVARAVKGMEVVFHQAALPSVPQSVLDPASCHDVNVTGTLNLLLAARDEWVRRVVFASSCAIYGDSEELPKRESMTPRPLSPYAAAKLMGEHYCRLFYQHYGLETVALRYFNVFGPRQSAKSDYAAVIPRFISAVMAGEAPVIFGDGEQSRDFVSVHDVAAANLAAATSPRAPGNVYNVARGERLTLNRLVACISDLLGREVRPVYRPERAGDVRHSLACIDAARRDLGFEPDLDLAAGIGPLVEEYALPLVA